MVSSEWLKKKKANIQCWIVLTLQSIRDPLLPTQILSFLCIDFELTHPHDGPPDKWF